MRIDPHLARRAANYQPLSPLDLFERSVEVHSERIAVVWGERCWTYAEFGKLVRVFAGRLEERGIGRGDTVSVIAANRPEMLAAHFAVPMTGAVLNAINIRLDHEAVAQILAHGEAKLVLSDPAHANLARAAAGSIAVEVFGEGFELEGRPPAPEVDWRSNVTDEWQPICLNYTSGTTGSPKGAVCHHRGAYLNALGNVLALGFGPETVNLWTLPMFHCNGWSHTWAVLAAGGTNVCLDGVDPATVYTEIARTGVTHMSCAPVVLYMLLDHPDSATRSAASPRVRVATGGAAPTTSLIERMEGLGFDLVHLYGLTESYGPVSMMQLDPEEAAESAERKARKLARQGHRHMTASRARVLRKDGAEVARDATELGEIVLRGNTLIAGYVRNPDVTAEAFAGDVFHTGDLAVVHPDGAIEIRDRAKDIIITGGENVASLEVEDALHRHPDVLIAAVVAAPHPKWGETPYAFVELRKGAQLGEEELIAFAREHLAHFKVPRRVIFSEVPKTATGKVQKYLLREEARRIAGEGA